MSRSYRIIFTSTALGGLDRASRFMNVQGIPARIKQRILAKLISSTQALKSHPNKFQEEEWMKHLGMGHRRLIVGTYKIVYLVKDDVVYIIDFFDVRQDPTKMNY